MFRGVSVPFLRLLRELVHSCIGKNLIYRGLTLKRMIILIILVQFSQFFVFFCILVGTRLVAAAMEFDIGDEDSPEAKGSQASPSLAPKDSPDDGSI